VQARLLITDAVPVPAFANHESFHIKYSWLKKAYDKVYDDGQVFVRDDATIKLGVGKNMVRAIRYWAMTSKIITANKLQKNSKMEPTDMGAMIFDKKGFDPYMGHPDTLWLLHWLIFSPPCRIPVWWIIMNEFPATNVQIDDMSEYIKSRIINIPEWKTPSEKSIEKDISVFIHTYSTRQDKLSIEEYLDCPFRQLHMIKQNSRETIRFVFGKKPKLSPLVIAFACLDFIRQTGITSKSISVSRLATEAGSVGNTFKISEIEIADMLKEACESVSSIRMQNTGGSPHLAFNDAIKSSIDVLESLYGKKTSVKRPRIMELAH